MTLRRLPAALPLAALVAVLAHLAAVGLGHAPGGSHANDLALGLAGMLALSVLGAFARGAFAPASATIATGAPNGYPPWVLAAVGFSVYVVLELAEGHLAIGGALRALAAALPAALVVGFASGRVRSFARRAGVRFAGFARSRALRTSVLGLAWTSPTLWARSSRALAKRRGRAPPAAA